MTPDTGCRAGPRRERLGRAVRGTTPHDEETIDGCDAQRFGAAGYTLGDVRGGGRGGAREGAWEADRSIELKVVCEADVAERFAAHVLAAYCPHYAVTMYLADVGVLRPEKF